MAAVIFDITTSLDGFIAGPNPSVEHPLGEGGERLHEWAYPTASFREVHGEGGGETGIDNDVLAEAMGRAGAFVMGRNMFGGGEGPWGDDPWRGWWGEDPPFHVPVLVLTHHAREPLQMEGGTTFTFVTDGIETAVEQARAAAGDRDVSLAGGANVIQQALQAGLVDEMELHVVPVMLGSGTRLFDGLADAGIEVEKIRAIDSPNVTHLTFRIVK